MLKTMGMSVIALAVLAAGGWFYYSHQQTTTIQNITPAPAPVMVAPANRSDDELNKQREQGIGSIKNLKPVPIEPAPDRTPKK